MDIGVYKAKVAIRKRHIPEKHSHRYCRNTRYWHYHTIRVQGIRNDDQSLSLVIPLVFLLLLILLRNISNLAYYLVEMGGPGRSVIGKELLLP